MSPTIIHLFNRNAGRFSMAGIVKYKPGPRHGYRDIHWSELEGLVVSFACGLIQRGLAPGDRVGLLSRNRLEWLVADLGIMMAGGVVVPIPPTGTPDQCAHIIEDCGAGLLVVEDLVQLYKVTLKRLPALDTIVLMDGPVPENDRRVTALTDLQENGLFAGQRLIDELDTRRGDLGRDDPATIVYVPETAEPPKGCLVNHGNIMRFLDAVGHILTIDPPSHQGLLVLPLTDLYARLAGCYFNLYQNIPLAMGESPEALFKNLAEVRPTYFCGDPGLFEKMHAASLSLADAGKQRKGRLFQRTAEHIDFNELLKTYGGNLDFVVSAGASVSEEMEAFFSSLGLRIVVIYGITETLGGTMTSFERYRSGTVGRPMPGFEVDMAQDGEILIRGNNFQGYYNQPEATARFIRRGWCHTGDLGQWDLDGFLVVAGPKSDLIVTSNGKRIFPHKIENRIRAIPFITGVLVHGDGKEYLTALLTLDREAVLQMAEEKKMESHSFHELVETPEIQSIVKQEIDRVNAGLSPAEAVKRFRIFPRPLFREQGDNLPAVHADRKMLREKYRTLLESLYQDGLPDREEK